MSPLGAHSMSRRERQRRRRRNRGPARILFFALGATATVGVLGVIGFIAYVIGTAANAPSLSTLRSVDKGASSQVFAKDGQRLGFIQSDELRQPVTIAQMPQALRDATVAIEDQRYFQHAGVDIEGIVRAAVKNLGTGRTVQGGSTLTMQLVRNLYLPTQHRDFKLKIWEAKLAEQLEQAHPGRDGKLWILTEYLNGVPYGTVGGQTAIGVQAASRIFFDKPVSKLSLPQLALLAGLPQAPSEYNPFINPEAALARRNDVLSKMAAQRYITPEQARAATTAPLGVHHSTFYTQHRESYFFDYVKQQLIDTYGINRVRQGGLKIYTTIDLRLQDAARKAMTGVLNERGDPSSAVVSIDPRSGYILAMASTAAYGNSQFNLAAQGHRQAGSSFKVMVLMTAVRQGIDPNTTTYNSHQLDFVDPRYGPIHVQTYSHSYEGDINLVQATLKSDNTVYQQLDLDVGPQNVAKTAHDMGVTSHLDGYPAEGLGGLRIGVSPLEMADAYATIADGGWRNKPIAITRVQFPDGHSDDLGRPHRVKVFSDAVTSTVTGILEQNMHSGTATHADIGCPDAGKTGTVDNFTDAWLVGFTPHMATSVWVGYPNRKVPMTDVHGIQVQGGSLPADIWHDYMSVAHGSDCSDFPQPQDHASLSPGTGSHASASGGGGSGNGNSGNGGSNGGNGHPGGGNGHGGGAGGNYNNRRLYESRPQPPPGKGGGGGGAGHGGGGHRGGGGGGGAGGGAGGGHPGGGGGGGTASPNGGTRPAPR
jgi:penicillin-binding protein 1A